MLFSLYSAVAVGIYGLVIMSSASSIPIILPIALVIIVFGTVIATLIGFYYLLFPPRRKPIGIELTESNEPKLWELVNTTAKFVERSLLLESLQLHFPASVFI